MFSERQWIQVASTVIIRETNMSVIKAEAWRDASLKQQATASLGKGQMRKFEQKVFRGFSDSI